ncbi:MAG: outer membrane protein assembly factor BamA [Bdellovibrionaceae bacterium]|nr:outer membrane protein assembly factor BamA [Pseudobdellovibrionaceae bacterium]
MLLQRVLSGLFLFGLLLPSWSQGQVTSLKKEDRRRNMEQSRRGGLSTPQKAGFTDTYPSIRAIKVKGLRKIDEKMILDRLMTRVGDTLNLEQLRQDILVIYGTGYFDDVQAYLEEQAVLVIEVLEKPNLVEIQFVGNDEIKVEDLKENVPLKTFEILDYSKLQTAKDKLQKFYESKGYLLAKVDYEVEQIIPGETVRVIFKIQEGEKVKVKKIKFLGNKKLSEAFLKSKMATSEEGFFHFMSGSGSFKQEAYERDWQLLRLIYMNEGFMQAKIERPQIFVTPDKKHIYITFRIEEGERYRIGEIDFAGDLLFPREELDQIVEIKNQEFYSYEVMQKDLLALQAKYGDLGYAYANVFPRTRINEKEKIVDITFEFDKGNLVYFGKISITGNTRTRDRVIRRELRILEGELYNETNRRRSLENVQRLGFFEDVQFRTSSRQDDPDKMDVEIQVKERNTGTLQLSAGYGTVAGFTINGSVNQINFLGKGQRLGASLNSSRIGSFYNLNFTDPNYDDSNYLVGFDMYQSAIDRFEYREGRSGGAIRVGRQFSDYFSSFFKYELAKVEMGAYYDQNNNLMTDLTIFPIHEASGWQSSLSGTVEYDERDDRFMPSRGRYAMASVEYAGLGGDLKFTKTTATFRYFRKIFWEVVWRNNLTHGYVTGHGGRDVPFNQRFLLGGPFSLRGYRFFRVGQRRYSEQLYNKYLQLGINPTRASELANVPFGGTQQLLLQTELEFPLIKEAGIRGAIFFDIGQAEDEIALSHFYSNFGFGFRWFSPLGPLRFEWGFPLRDNPLSPEKTIFEFTIGAPF